MAKKMPKLFAGEFSAEQLQKKFLKRIYIREYRDLLNRAFSKNQRGLYVLRPDLDRKQAAALKRIAKSIKRNTGFVLKTKLAVVLFVLGAAAVFNIVFKDAIAKRAAEAGLESVFQARAEIKGLRFQPLRGRISLDSLTVADSEKPLYNLFELGKTEVSVNVIEALKGNVVINDIESREIKWDTRRSVSGALPGRQSARPAGSAGTGALGSASSPAPDPFAFAGGAVETAAALFEREKANLKSPALLDELNKTYPALADKWRAKSGEMSEEMSKLTPAMKAVSGIKIDEIKSAEDAQKAYAAIQSAGSSLNAVKKDVDGTYSDFSKDLDRAKSDRKAVLEAIDGDFRRLKSYVSLGSGGTSFVTPLIESILGKNVSGIYASALRALSYGASLKPASKGEAAKAPRGRPRGFFVAFPSRSYPKFWLQNMGVSFGSEKADHTSGGIKNVTDQPDLVGKPATFDFENVQGRQSLTVSGYYDGRRGRDTVLDCRALLKNYSIEIGDGLRSLGVEKMECLSDMRISVSIDDRGRASGALGIDLRRIKVTGSAAKKGISSKVVRALEAADLVSIQAGYSYSDSGALEMKVKTNLDRIIGDVANAAAADAAKDAEKRLRAELDGLVGDKLGRYDSLYSDLLKTDGSFTEDRKDLGGYGKTLEDKKRQVDDRLAGLQKDAAKKGAKELKKIKGKMGF